MSNAVILPYVYDTLRLLVTAYTMPLTICEPLSEEIIQTTFMCKADAYETAVGVFHTLSGNEEVDTLHAPTNDAVDSH